MSFDLNSLRRAVDAQGCVVRLVVAAVQGSTPRGAGAAMLIWQDGQSGTIGGGRLELDAVRQARMLLTGGNWLRRFALGPDLGQCCGGRVTLLAECYDAKSVASLGQKSILRQVTGSSEIPGQINYQLNFAQKNNLKVNISLIDGWMLEPVLQPERQIWVYGAGHVGRAIVDVLAPLQEFEIHWIDVSEDRFPASLPTNVKMLVSANPADVVRFAPKDAEHLILTYSHDHDLEICHQLLGHGFESAGLIGSETKWARFRGRLAKLGHSSARISQICCPIGEPRLGKQPQAIAVGVVAGLLSQAGLHVSMAERVG